MATTNIQSFAGDVEVSGELTVTGQLNSTTGSDKVKLTATTADETDYIPLSKGTTGAQALYTDSNLAYNPANNVIGANISGSATNATYATSAGSATNATSAANATSATFATNATNADAANTVAFTDRDSNDETDYIAFVANHTPGDKALYTDSNLTYNPANSYINANVPYANNAGTLDGSSKSTGANANSIAQRNGSSDLYARLFRSTYANQNSISGGMAFRVNNGNDNYIRFCSNTGSIRTFLNVPTRTGGNASGTWSIDVNGSAGSAGSAGNISSSNATMPAYIKHSGDTNTYFGFPGNDTYVIVTNNSERLRVESGGDVGIGLTNPTQKLHVSGNILANGDVTAYSDKRLKSNIAHIENALDKVTQLNGYTYTLNETNIQSTGLIAQEVLDVLPEAVHGSKDTQYSLAYGNLMGLAVEAIKELESKLTVALARIDAIENRTNP